MKHILTSALCGLLNTHVTLVNDLFINDVPDIELADTKNISINMGQFVIPWVVQISASLYTARYYSDGANHSNLLNFNKSFDVAAPQLAEFMEEGDAEEFLAEVAMIPAHVETISHACTQVTDEDEMNRQLQAAMIISQWFVILRWFEHSEVIGLDEAVVYTPSYDVETVDGVEVLTINNNCLSVEIYGDKKPPRIKGSNLTVEEYAMVAYKNDPDANASYYIDEAIKEIDSVSSVFFS